MRWVFSNSTCFMVCPETISYSAIQRQHMMMCAGLFRPASLTARQGLQGFLISIKTPSSTIAHIQPGIVPVNLPTIQILTICCGVALPFPAAQH
ncbi:hypothetical protein ACLK1S_14910 [Escherichia coli]